MEGKGTGTFSIQLGGLSVNTTYYFCAYATNSSGTGYGNPVSFKTYGALLPALKTTTVTSITSSTAISGGFSIYNGSGTIISRGVCWAKSPNPSVNDFKTEDLNGTEDSFVSHLTQLEADNTYYLRAYATNEAGTGYGELLSFKTVGDLSRIEFNTGLTYGSVPDIDGKIYKTIKIGNQEWMAENLRASRFTDGRDILHILPNFWAYSDSPLYVLNETYVTYTNSLGAYYNWHTVETGKICPSGWHVPSYEEWTILVNFLGGDSVAGGKLKETGTIHWNSPNAKASNETGFSALPGGHIPAPWYFGYTNSFQLMGDQGIWWSSSKSYECCAWTGSLSYKNSGFSFVPISKEDGCPVRCIKD